MQKLATFCSQSECGRLFDQSVCRYSRRSPSPGYMAKADGGYPLTTLRVGYAILSSEPSFLTFTSIENFWPFRPLKKPRSLSMKIAPPQWSMTLPYIEASVLPSCGSLVPVATIFPSLHTVHSKSTTDASAHLGKSAA